MSKIFTEIDFDIYEMNKEYDVQIMYLKLN